MPKIGPPQTLDALAKSCHRVRKGESVGLPPASSDVEQMQDKHAEEANRALGQAISKALTRFKPEKDANGQPLFILGWRMYPNQLNKHWQDLHEHACGCGCGGYAPGPGDDDGGNAAPLGAKARAKPSASRKRAKPARSGRRRST